MTDHIQLTLSIDPRADDEDRQRAAQLLAAQLRELDGIDSVRNASQALADDGGKSGLEGFDWGALIVALSAVGLENLLGYLRERLKERDKADDAPQYVLRTGDIECPLSRPLTPEEFVALRGKLADAARKSQSEDS
jgi:hypothetical protein